MIRKKKKILIKRKKPLLKKKKVPGEFVKVSETVFKKENGCPKCGGDWWKDEVNFRSWCNSNMCLFSKWGY